MKPIMEHKDMVAYCGLFCGACRRFLKDKCPGCHENDAASWCKIRVCCMENGYASCADCSEYDNPNDCRYFNNFFSKIFALIFRSDRAACIQQIKDLGLEGHAKLMAELGLQSIKKQNSTQ